MYSPSFALPFLGQAANKILARSAIHRPLLNNHSHYSYDLLKHNRGGLFVPLYQAIPDRIAATLSALLSRSWSDLASDRRNFRLPILVGLIEDLRYGKYTIICRVFQ